MNSKVVFDLSPELFFYKNTEYIEKMIFEDAAFDKAIGFGACISKSVKMFLK